MYRFGRKFILPTDHKPLLKIFAPDSASPVLAAARLQRWYLLLSSYHYEIEFQPSAEVPRFDALSRLPLWYKKDTSVEDKVLQVSVEQLSRHPVSALEIARKTAWNPVLGRALALTQACPLLHHPHVQAIMPYIYVGFAHYHTSYSIRANSERITPGSPRSSTHEGNTTQSHVVARDRQRH